MGFLVGRIGGPFEPVDADDVGAGIGQHHAGERRRTETGQLDDPDALERAAHRAPPGGRQGVILIEEGSFRAPLFMAGWWPLRARGSNAPPVRRSPIAFDRALVCQSVPRDRSREEPLVPLVRRAVGPGRVNLIGDHTDYNQGLALPMAIGLGVTATFTPIRPPRLSWSRPSAFAGNVELPLDIPSGRRGRSPPSPRPGPDSIGAMVALARPDSGGVLTIESNLPVGSGLSSSAALCTALAEVFGVTGPPPVIARLCQQAEHLTGVPVGVMDPLVCAGAIARPRHAHRLLDPVHRARSGCRRTSRSWSSIPANAGRCARPTTQPGWPSARRPRPSSGRSGRPTTPS